MSNMTDAVPPSEAPAPVLIFWDTETTGIGRSDEIIEFGMLRVPWARVMDTSFEYKNVRIRPTAHTEFPQATAVHGLTYDEHLAHCPSFTEAATELLAFIEESLKLGPTIMVAHNSSFDRRMLDAELERAGLRMPPGVKYACSLEMVRAASRAGDLALSSHRLGAAYEELTGQKIVGAHGALVDARSILQILQHLRLNEPAFQGPSCPFIRLVEQASA